MCVCVRLLLIEYDGSEIVSHVVTPMLRNRFVLRCCLKGRLHSRDYLASLPAHRMCVFVSSSFCCYNEIPYWDEQTMLLYAHFFIIVSIAGAAY